MSGNQQVSGSVMASLHSAAEDHLFKIMSQAKTLAMRRQGFRSSTAAASAKVAVEIEDINGALSAHGEEYFYHGDCSGAGAGLGLGLGSDGDGGPSPSSAKKDAAAAAAPASAHELSYCPPPWRLIVEWVAVDGAMVSSSGVGGQRRQQSRSQSMMRSSSLSSSSLSSRAAASSSSSSDGAISIAAATAAAASGESKFHCHLDCINPTVTELIASFTNPKSSSKSDFNALAKAVLSSLPQSVLYPTLVPSLVSALDPANPPEALARPLSLLHSLLLSTPALFAPVPPPPIQPYLHSVLPALLTLALTDSHPKVTDAVRSKAVNVLRFMATVCEESSPDLQSRLIAQGMKVVSSYLNPPSGNGDDDEEGEANEGRSTSALCHALQLVLQPSLSVRDSPNIYRAFIRPHLPALSSLHSASLESVRPYAAMCENDGGDCGDEIEGGDLERDIWGGERTANVGTDVVV